MRKFFVLSCLLIAGILLRAWTLHTLWGWFIADYFSVKQITMPVACGLSILAAMFRHIPNDEFRRHPEDTEADEIARDIGRALFMPLLAMAFGAIVRFWMP